MKNDRYNLILSISLLLLIVVLISGWGIFRKSRLDSGSQQLAINAVQTIFTANNGQFLIENSHEDYLREMSAESFNKYISSTQFILGPLSSINTISGASDASFNPLSRQSANAEYELDLTFDNGEATAQATLIYQQGRWQFTAFVLLSEQLID